jgi:hypothetical protein
MSDEQPQDDKEIKSRATVEDLLGLSVHGWQDIAKMNDEQLAEYLKDITILEPKGDITDSQIRGAKITKSKALQEIENDNDQDNPIKLNKPKAKKKKSVTETLNLDDFEKELGL